MYTVTVMRELAQCFPAPSPTLAQLLARRPLDPVVFATSCLASSTSHPVSLHPSQPSTPSKPTCSSLLNSLNNLLRPPLNQPLNLLPLLLRQLNGLLAHTQPLLATLPHQNPRDLRAADAEEQEVDRGEEEVLGPDDEAPAGPDQAGGDEGAVLGEGEGGGRAGEVGGAG